MFVVLTGTTKNRCKCPVSEYVSSPLVIAAVNKGEYEKVGGGIRHHRYMQQHTVAADLRQ